MLTAVLIVIFIVALIALISVRRRRTPR